MLSKIRRKKSMTGPDACLPILTVHLSSPFTSIFFFRMPLLLLGLSFHVFLRFPAHRSFSSVQSISVANLVDCQVFPLVSFARLSALFNTSELASSINSPTAVCHFSFFCPPRRKSSIPPQSTKAFTGMLPCPLLIRAVS